MKKRFSEEQIITILREAKQPRGTAQEVSRRHGISEQTFYRWRRKYEGRGVNEAVRLRQQSEIGPVHIDPGKPWQNGVAESFIGKLRDEGLDREWFHTLEEARIFIEMYRKHYNRERPHSGLGY